MTTHYPALTVLALFLSTAVAERRWTPIGRSAGVRARASKRPGLDTTALGAC